MDSGTGDYVEEDADGALTGPNFVVDLSHLLSVRLGRQLPQMATYRVKGFRLSLENVDNTNDNNYGLSIGGVVQWYSPTEKRVDALQYARQYKRDMMSTLAGSTSDPFAPFTSGKDYTGLRFNWSEDADGVYGAINDGSSVMSGNEFSMYEIFDHYNEAIGGNPSDEGHGSGSSAGDALWTTRVGEGMTDAVSWECSYRNSAWFDQLDVTDDGFSFEPESMPYELMMSANHFDVLGGLLLVKCQHTNTENPRFGDVNDEYHLRLTVFVEGWEAF